jgi:hypothetical protein
MPISQNTFYNWSAELIDLANDLDVATLEELRDIVLLHIESPQGDYSRRIERFVDSQSQQWVENAEGWLVVALPGIYLSGLRMEDRELASMVENPRNEGNSIPSPRFNRATGGQPSPQAIEALRGHPNHLNAYAAYENTFREAIRRTANPYNRSTVQGYRELARVAMMSDFISGNEATRINLAQRVLNELADNGIKTVTFPTGHRMSIEAFAEREARAYSGQVARQGQINRAVERGYDLVQINSYAGASPMCEPYQGKVFSLSGDSEQYPPLEGAIFAGSWDFGGGVYHDYCGHMQSTYIPGASEAISMTDDPLEQSVLDRMGEARGNREIYENRQVQRRNEYQIRLAKKRKAASLDPRTQQRADQSIKHFQAKQREWIKEHPYLKRNPRREQVI